MGVEPAYPPPPWRTHGPAVLSLGLVDVQKVRPLIPTSLEVVPVWPGKTLGGILSARYIGNSTLHYNELAIVSGVVRQGFRLGLWISHIYVDHEQSLLAGREVWGLPKEMASFGRDEDTTVVSQGEGVLCSVQHGQSLSLGPLPGWVPVFGSRQEKLCWFTGIGTFRGGLTRAKITIPPGSPFAGLGLERPIITVSGVVDVRVNAPCREVSR